MYIPKYFKNEDPAGIIPFLKEYNFGVLITGNGRPQATHIPFEVIDKGNNDFSLFAHISRVNKQWESFDVTEVLAIFTGAHTYVSPSLYTAPNVPTWNYIAVHVYGTIRMVEGDKLRARMSDMVKKYEAHSQNPMPMEALDESYIVSHLKGIVALELIPTEIQAKAKLSQNRDKQSYDNIINHLEKGDENSQRIAAEMEKLKQNKS